VTITAHIVFGLRWNMSEHVRDVPHDETVAAAAKAFSGS
jgi:hypothetical protein